MKRYLWAVIISFLCVVGLHAQSTTVSGTVTDAGSQTWNSGTYQFSFVPVANYNGPYSWTGGAFNPVTTYNGALDGSGHYSVSIPDNATITPTGTSWTLTVCPQGTGTCYNTTKIITGGTQTVNAAPPAISVPPGPNSSVYATSEIANGQLGSLAYVIGTGVEVCTAVTSGACTTWTTVGGGGGGAVTKVCSQVAITMPTSAIGSAAESSTVTGTCTGLTTSDSISCTSAVHISGVTGFAPSTNGILTVLVWPTSNTINLSYENNTGGSITPGALTIHCGAFR